MAVRRLVDVDLTDRGDGKVPVWSDADSTHVYEDKGGGGGGGLLGRDAVGNATNSATTYSTTFADVVHNSETLSVDVTVPASGSLRVMVRLPFVTTTGRLRLVDGTSTFIAGTVRNFAGGTNVSNAVVIWHLDGLSPGSLTIKPQIRGSAGNVDVWTSPPGNTDASWYGPVTLEVWAA